jgi:hypothetical protein
VTAAKKPAAPPWNLPWNVRVGGGTIIEDSDGNMIACTSSQAMSRLQRNRMARIARFICDTANATIKPAQGEERM